MNSHGRILVKKWSPNVASLQKKKEDVKMKISRVLTTHILSLLKIIYLSNHDHMDSFLYSKLPCILEMQDYLVSYPLIFNVIVITNKIASWKHL